VPLLIRTRHIDVEYPNASISKHAFTSFADHVLTTSRKITDHFQKVFHLPADQITTLPTGIDVHRFSPGGGKAELPVLKETNSAPVVGMVSVLRSWKGHPVFFDAARLLREAGRKIQFVVIGGGAPVERFQALAREHGVGALIQFTGHREDVPEVLRALDLLVIPSTRHEGVPQIGLQALACETPVIGSACGGIPEIIREGDTGRIFPIGDAQALADRIAEALDQHEETRRMSENGRRFVAANHSLEAMLDTLDALYRSHIR
jgi:glycosyltransferase involved in cell wall biosynthesis